jgi:hypothetical protein
MSFYAITLTENSGSAAGVPAVYLSFAIQADALVMKVDPAFRRTHLSQTDPSQFCRWSLVSAAWAERGQGRVHFFEIDLFPGGHLEILEGRNAFGKSNKTAKYGGWS